jgi:hypothetical protein
LAAKKRRSGIAKPPLDGRTIDDHRNTQEQANPKPIAKHGLVTGVVVMSAVFFMGVVVFMVDMAFVLIRWFIVTSG